MGLGGRRDIGKSAIIAPNSAESGARANLLSRSLAADIGYAGSRQVNWSFPMPVREYPAGLTQFCNLDFAISIGSQTPWSRRVSS
jgi:hypothetical protein